MSKSAVDSLTEVVVDLTEKTLIKVLHVDDEISFLKVSKQCLEMEGHFQVDTASSVEEAFEKMKNEQFDVVVSDYMMPGKDGLEFLKELRHSGNKIPFIVFTGKGREEVAIRALNLGADQYLNKTGGPETVYGELAHSVRQAVEKRRAEEKLRKSEEELRGSLNKLNLILSTLEDGLDIVSYDYVVRYQNKFLKDRFGDLIGKKCYVGYMGFDEPCSFCAMRKAIRYKKTFRVELTGKDGRSYELISMPLEHQDGHIDALEIVRDISERKMAGEAILESQQKFEGLFRDNPEAAVYVDPDFKVLDVNPCFEQLFGHRLDEIKGKKLRDLIVPKDRLEEGEMLDRKAKRGHVHHDTFRKRNDGVSVPVSISAAPIRIDGKLVGYVGLYKDITARKKAEEQLEESRRHFQTLFNLMVDPVAIVDKKGKILEVTQRVEEITGFKREELVGKNFLETKIATTKSKAIMIKNLAKRMMGMHMAPYGVEIFTKDGKKLPYEINAAKIEYKDKAADLVVFRDVSERRKMEEKLRVVGNLTRHDVRNKLTRITGNVYLAKRKLASDHEVQEHLKEIELACRQVERVFDFARDYERLGIEELVYVDVHKTLGEAVSLFSNLQGVTVVNDCQGLTVLADSLLRQIFYNLIDNSLKYGEKISKIRVYYEETGRDGMKLVYEDNGVGMSKNEKKKLFMEGYGKGTGYGLYLIRKICEVYGWNIQETGKHGKGVQFTITMPRISECGKENYRLH